MEQLTCQLRIVKRKPVPLSLMCKNGAVWIMRHNGASSGAWDKKAILPQNEAGWLCDWRGA